MEKWYPAAKQPDKVAVVRVYELHRATLDAERRASRPSAPPEARTELRAALQTEQDALREYDFETFGAFSAEYDEESSGVANEGSVAADTDLDRVAPSKLEVENDELRQRLREIQEELTQTHAAQQQRVSSADSRLSEARASIAALEDENSRLRAVERELVTARNQPSQDATEMLQQVRADLEAMRECIGATTTDAVRDMREAVVELRELISVTAEASEANDTVATQPTRRCLPLSIANHFSRELRRTYRVVVRPISKLAVVRS